MEFDADRVSLAYWRGVDPTVVTRIMLVVHQVLTIFPDPPRPASRPSPASTPTTRSSAPLPAYRWYQSQMNVAADHERPIPTFKQILTAVTK